MKGIEGFMLIIIELMTGIGGKRKNEKDHCNNHLVSDC